MNAPASSRDTAAPAEYYPHFDLLRFVLAAVVLIRHDSRLTWLIPYESAGNFAVQVFFALSGWLIGGILIQTRPEAVGRFYFNRVCRIWAPYFVALVLLVAVGALRMPIGWRTAEFIAYKASFTYNLFGPPQLAASRDLMPLGGTGNHFWSVDAEEQFYLIAPLLLVFLPTRIGQSRLLWSTIAAAALAASVFPSIVLGVLAALWKQQRPDLFDGNRLQNLAIAPTVAAGVGLALGAPYMVAAPLFSVGLVLSLARTGVAQPVQKYLGAISYPLYLNHWIGIFMANAVFKKLGQLDHPLRDLASFALSVAVAALLYRLVDQPVLARRARWWNARRGRLAMGASYALIVIGLAIGLALGRELNWQG